jgi:NAD(P)-dependent dehydrogenase (short-subunit alcohol dehydrogenase family)
MGATIIIIGRSPEKTALIAGEIRSSSGNQNIEYLTADLLSQTDIRKLADDFKKRHNKLDVLINNAGGIFKERKLTIDGIERTFALNVLAPFLLTNLLLDTIKAGSPARIINVSSSAHTSGKIEFDNLQSERSWNFRAYGSSKLALLLLTAELARRLQGTDITVNALHPGFVNTNFGSDFKGLMAVLFNAVKLFFSISPEKGAETIVYLASSPEVLNITGKYFVKSRLVKAAPEASDMNSAERLWGICSVLTHLV